MDGETVVGGGPPFKRRSHDPRPSRLLASGAHAEPQELFNPWGGAQRKVGGEAKQWKGEGVLPERCRCGDGDARPPPQIVHPNRGHQDPNNKGGAGTPKRGNGTTPTAGRGTPTEGRGAATGGRGTAMGAHPLPGAWQSAHASLPSFRSSSSKAFLLFSFAMGAAFLELGGGGEAKVSISLFLGGGAS